MPGSEYTTEVAGTESPHPTPSTEKRARQELRQYLGQGPRDRENPYLQTHLAQIRKVERDAQGRLTGYATVEVLTMTKNTVRAQVLMPVPASQYWFVGGLPPTDTLCAVSWLPQGVGIILAYYPVVYRKLVEEHGLRDLELGEVLVQSEVTENAVRRAGATILLGRDGSVEVADKDGVATILVAPDGTVTVEASSRVTVRCDDVNLGGEAGEEVVLRSFLDAYNAHTHTGVTTGGGASGPPSSQATSQHTTKTRAE